MRWKVYCYHVWLQKKKPKRQRIESSGSDSEQLSPKPDNKSSPKSEPNSDVESSPKSDIKSSPKEEKLKINVEKTDSPKTYASPKSKKGRPKPLKEANKSVLNETSKHEKSATEEKASKSSPSPKRSKVKKEVVSNGTPLEKKENLNAKQETEDNAESSENVPGKIGFSWNLTFFLENFTLVWIIFFISHTYGNSIKIINLLLASGEMRHMMINAWMASTRS